MEHFATIAHDKAKDVYYNVFNQIAQVLKQRGRFAVAIIHYSNTNVNPNTKSVLEGNVCNLVNF